MIGSGARILYRLRVHGLPLRWEGEISEWDPPHGFVDTQLRGPYALWRHSHRLIPEGGGTRMLDRVEYALPFGALGAVAHVLLVRRDLELIFEYRRRRIAELFPAL